MTTAVIFTRRSNIIKLVRASWLEDMIDCAVLVERACNNNRFKVLKFYDKIELGQIPEVQGAISCICFIDCPPVLNYVPKKAKCLLRLTWCGRQQVIFIV